MEAILETKAETVLQFVHGLRSSLHVTLEEGTCAGWLHDMLKPHIAGVLVCDPRKSALLKSVNKNDHIDARKLADLLRTGLLTGLSRGAWHPGAEGVGAQLHRVKISGQRVRTRQRPRDFRRTAKLNRSMCRQDGSWHRWPWSVIRRENICGSFRSRWSLRAPI